MNARTGKSLTVRLTPELYRAAAEIAHDRDISINSLISDSLSATVRAAEAKTRYDEYTLLGQDPDCNVEYTIHAQAEVMLRDDQ